MKSSSKPKSLKKAQEDKTKTQPQPTRARGGQLTTYILWQSSAIAQATSELADHIEVVGDKQSTVNKIDGLRMAIVYTTNQFKDLPPNRRKIMELHDLLKTILEHILPYYRSTQTKPDPEKNALKLHRLAERLNALICNCGGSNGDWPIETMTDELRGLAEDLRQYSFIDVETAGRAESLMWLIDAVFADLCERQKELTNDEERAKSYLRQIHSLLDDVIDIGRSRRFQQSSDEIEKRANQLEHFAKRLDECPPIAKYRQFWQRLRQAETKSESPEREAGKAEPLEGNWSKPMSKSEMMRKLQIDGYKKFNSYANSIGLKPIEGNRQLFQLRLDTMDKNMRARIEKS